MESGAAHSLEVSVDRLQVVLELGYELLLSALQRLPVLHAVLQGLEHAAHAGAQRLNAADRMREGVQVHPNVHHVRHLLRFCFFFFCFFFLLFLLLLLLVRFRQFRRCLAYYCPPQVR